MRTLIFLLSLMMMTATAHAKNIEIFSYKADAFYKIIPSFNINPNIAKAWLTVGAFRIDSNGVHLLKPEVQHISIDGLSYDVANQKVLYTQEDGTQTTCATVKNNKHITHIVQSDHCRLYVKTEIKDVDHVLYALPITYQTLYLEIY